MNLAEFPGVAQITHSYSRRLPARLILNYDLSWSAGVASRIHPGVYPIPMGSLKNVSQFGTTLALQQKGKISHFSRNFASICLTKKCENFAKKFGIKKRQNTASTPLVFCENSFAKCEIFAKKCSQIFFPWKNAKFLEKVSEIRTKIFEHMNKGRAFLYRWMTISPYPSFQS